ncbi:hypothetical protein nbrc107696_22400 [Gordonia spumicola]|uniref:GXWXG protein n=1 Tax=Gordonia spumicola TaxID=589161 RepID=A0A7I9V985_9ACTN|nr:DUF4334 domain-containing protein [Gordonia spumicola]GEE01638.1 hypothetical protein nbrc107696_20840 [Gordonia spumicola]GEE01794.1 hypothetical protein nbrc107696_22400 [Gordonia spumicola]
MSELTERDAVADFHRRAASQEPSDPAELDAIWAALPTVAIDEILGDYRGGELPSGHALDGSLATVGWHGKWLRGRYDVAPMVCRNADGELYSNLEIGKGAASLWNVEFRGEVTATMVYDGQPVFDHFKRVDENTLMGIMNGSTSLVRDRHFYFFLVRE